MPFRSLLLFLFLLGFFTREGLASPEPNGCEAYLRYHERRHAIPPGLLQAIAKVESGHKQGDGRVSPWPWTVNAQGKGYYFATKQAAIAAVQAMQFKGIRSIDVGCMQVNLYHHPQAFKSLDEAFEPAHNIAYAASFLTQLQKEHGSWHRAVAHYHSANPVFHIPYRKTVLALWKKQGERGTEMVKNTQFLTQSPEKSGRHFIRLATLKTPQNRTTPVFRGAIRRVTRHSPHLKHAPCHRP